RVAFERQHVVGEELHPARHELDGERRLAHARVAHDRHGPTARADRARVQGLLAAQHRGPGQDAPHEEALPAPGLVVRRRAQDLRAVGRDPRQAEVTRVEAVAGARVDVDGPRRWTVVEALLQYALDAVT